MEAFPQQFINHLKNLDTVPSVAIRVIEATRRSDSDSDEIGMLVESDPALSAKVLKTANSAWLGCSGKIASLPRAMTLLGVDMVRCIALSVVISKLFLEGSPTDARERFTLLWKHSLASGIGNELLTEKLCCGDPKTAFITGLIHDIGKFVLLQWNSELYLELLAAAEDAMTPLHILERKMIGTDHQTVGGLLLETWGFPDKLRVPVLDHHRDVRTLVGGPLAKSLLTLKAANSLAHLARLGASGDPKPEFTLSILPRIVGLSLEDVSQLGHEILRRFEQRAALFDLESSTPELFLTAAFRANEELSRRLEELEIQERFRLNAESTLGLREQELDRAKRLEAVGHIAESVAHDFNNLLTVIKGHVEMASGITSDDSPIGAHLREIEAAAIRAAALTEQILTFRKRQTLRPQPLSFNQELEAMEKILKRLLGPQILLESKTDPDLGLVLGDPGQIDQLLVNVALLSRESMPGGGTLRIHTSRNRETIFAGQKEEKSVDFAVVQVCLDPEDSEAGPNRSATQQNTGRNADSSQDDPQLKTLLRTVKQLGGVGRVTTGRGNTRVIAMRFPTLTSEAAHSIPVGKPDPFRPLGILMVDDEVSILRLLERSLSKAGFKVFTADQPETAEEIFQANAEQVDLLLSDVVMPRMSGMELYGRLLESRPDLKVLFISGYSRELVESTPGVPFLEKPFTPRKLVEMVKSVLVS